MRLICWKSNDPVVSDSLKRTGSNRTTMIVLYIFHLLKELACESHLFVRKFVHFLLIKKPLKSLVWGIGLH